MIKKYLLAYKEILVDSAKAFMANGILMYIGTVVILTTTLVNMFIGGYIIGGIIAYFVTAMAMSSYLYVIYIASDGYHADWNDARDGLYIYMRVIIGLMMLNYLVLATLNLFGMMSLYLIVNFLIWLLLNSLPEVISNRENEALDAIRYSFDFQIHHIFSWYIPNLLLFFAGSFIFDLILKNLWGMSLAFFSLKEALILVLSLIVFQAIFGYVMIFRQKLFRYLESNRKNRRFNVIK